MRNAPGAPGTISLRRTVAGMPPARPAPRRSAAGAIVGDVRELTLEADRVELARAGSAAILYIPRARIDERPAVTLVIRLTAAAESRLVAQLAGGGFRGSNGGAT